MDSEREAYWSRKLRPIRLGAEPIEAQLSRGFHARIVITAVTALIGLMILAIFAGFGRPDVGLQLNGLMVLPATLWFWLDFATLRSRVSAYLLERDGPHDKNDPPG